MPKLSLASIILSIYIEFSVLEYITDSLNKCKI